MSSLDLKIISEHVHMTFDVGDKSYCVLNEADSKFLLALQTCADKTVAQFKEVVVCRSLLISNPDGSIRHEQCVWVNKGPFTTEQFLRMMQYKAGILCKEWFEYMNNFSQVGFVR